MTSVESIAQLVALGLARQKAERVVLQQQQRLDALTDSAFVYTLELDAGWRIKKCNPVFQELSGFSVAELRGRSVFSAFILPEEMDRVQQTLRTAMETGAAQVECFLLTKGGARKRATWNFNRLLDDSGEEQILLGVGMDETEKCDAVEQLERARAAAENAVGSLRSLQKTTTNRESAAKSFDQSKEERRKKKRSPFPFKQNLAPMVGDQMPPVVDFREVRCHNLSPNGFAFWANEVPDYKRLVIAFGNGGSVIHVSAKIVHVTLFDESGSDMFLVGCNYTERLEDMCYIPANS